MLKSLNIGEVCEMRNWLSEGDNYNRLLIVLVGLVLVPILYVPLEWAILNIWCGIYGFLN